MTEFPAGEFDLIPKGRVAKLEAQVEYLLQQVDALVSIIAAEAEPEGDAAAAAFIQFRQRARQLERDVEVPWRTS